MYARLIIFSLTLFIICFSCKDTKSVESEKSAEENPTSQTEENPDNVLIYAWVNNLRIREKPDTKAPIITEVKEGTELEYLEQKTDFTQKINLRGTVYDEPWLKIKTLEGKQGWVYGGAVKFYRPTIDEGPSPYDRCFSISASSRKRRSNCIKQTVASQLKKDVNFAKSGPGGLTLNLLSGEQKKFFTEKNPESTDYVRYDYRYYIQKMGYFVLKATYFEGDSYLLVNDKSGNIIKLKGYPKPSPDFKHLIVTCGERNDYAVPTDIQLLGFTENGLEILWERDLKEYIALQPIWKNDNEVVFQMEHLEDSAENLKGSLTTTLGGQWVFSKHSNQ